MIWKDIKGFEGRYKISSDGDVKSIRKSIPEKILNPYVKRGFNVVGLWGNGECKKRVRIDKLVAEHFLRKSEKGKTKVFHINGNDLDDRYENLKWANQFDIRSNNVAYNKNMYGEKVVNFKLGKPNECKIHGVHFDWAYFPKFNQCSCKLCVKASSQKNQNNPNLKLEFIYRDARQHCRVSKKEFSITIEDIKNKFIEQNGLCALSGVKLSLVKKTDNCVSLDRVNSLLGYTKDNIQLVTVIINKMKSNFNEGLFLEICKNIHEYSLYKSFTLNTE